MRSKGEAVEGQVREMGLDLTGGDISEELYSRLLRETRVLKTTMHTYESPECNQRR